MTEPSQRYNLGTLAMIAIVITVAIALSACSRASTEVSAPTEAAALPGASPTGTAPPPTEAPPTDTPLPPADTPVPPTETPAPTATGTPTATATEPPTATPTPTALSEALKERILQTYGVITLIQLDAEGTNEIAEGLVSGELESFQAGIMRLAMATIIGSVEELIPELDPPAELAAVWEDALEAHEATKDVLRRWFNEEIDSKVVLEEMESILEDAEEAALDAGEAIEDAWEIAAEELGAMRDEVLQEFEELFSPTPAP
ncbi:MAG: hypothetical protein PVI67_10850 [Anaerolineae bacterium]